MAVDLKRRRFTVDEYHRMARAGILGEDDHVELIEGEIVEMTPIVLRPAVCVARLTRQLIEMLGDSAVVWAQNPIRLSSRTEVQPDLALLRPGPSFYPLKPPGPEGVLLVIEVAVSSVGPDRRAKVPLYARGAVPEVWLMDLEQQTVTVCADPAPNGYRTVRVARRGERLAPAAFPDCVLSVAGILD